MREELLKILEIKQKYVEDNIVALGKNNEGLEENHAKLDEVNGILDLFKADYDTGRFEINNFPEISKEKFIEILNRMPQNIVSNFSTDSCNYDGLIYLINGINNGISLSLTPEQNKALESFVRGLEDLKLNYLATIEGIELAKARLEIGDMDELLKIKDNYIKVISDLKEEKYVGEVKEVISAITYCRTDSIKMIDLLSYLLEYNAEIYKTIKSTEPKQYENNNDDEDVLQVSLTEEEDKDEKEEDLVLTAPLDLPEDTDYPEDLPVAEEEPELDLPEESEFEPLPENPDQVVTDEDVPDFDIPMEEDLPVADEIDSEFSDLAAADNFDLPEATEIEVNTTEEQNELDSVSLDDVSMDLPTELELPQEETKEEVKEEVKEEKEEVKETKPEITFEDVRQVISEYHVSTELIDENKLQDYNLEELKNVLSFLKDKDLLSYMLKNSDMVKALLLNTDLETISKVVEIVTQDLSVDKEDAKETLILTVATMPCLFINEPVGAAHTFISNVKTFKELKLELINLFDFSREVFMTDKELVNRNKELIETYKLDLNYKNAKYLLGLKNLANKLDLLIEANAQDKDKKKFDGEGYINTYTSKINMFNDIVIKRLRYSNEKALKIFGTKPNSLAGEITNLKVDVINMPDEYVRKFFNNDYEGISREVAYKYQNLVNDTNTFDTKEDELISKLDKYRDGSKYVIEKVYISRNKVIRVYNILVNNGVDNKEALHYAMFYNSVITKDEYDKVRNVLETLGGK